MVRTFCAIPLQGRPYRQDGFPQMKSRSFWGIMSYVQP